MEFIIKPMSPELEADYFDFFDHRAFSDGSPFSPCYCNAFNMSAARIRSEIIEPYEKNGGRFEDFKQALRQSAERMVRQGEICGYLVYDGEIAVGWCNANDKRSYYRFGEFDLRDPPADVDSAEMAGEEKIKSVVCFEIAPGYRGKGLALALLQRVCEDAAKEGYACVESYPQKRSRETELDFTGPVKLYEKAGFTLFARHGEKLVMRKTL